MPEPPLILFHQSDQYNWAQEIVGGRWAMGDERCGDGRWVVGGGRWAMVSVDESHGAGWWPYPYSIDARDHTDTVNRRAMRYHLHRLHIHHRRRHHRRVRGVRRTRRSWRCHCWCNSLRCQVSRRARLLRRACLRHRPIGQGWRRWCFRCFRRFPCFRQWLLRRCCFHRPCAIAPAFRFGGADDFAGVAGVDFGGLGHYDDRPCRQDPTTPEKRNRCFPHTGGCGGAPLLSRPCSSQPPVGARCMCRVGVDVQARAR